MSSGRFKRAANSTRSKQRVTGAMSSPSDATLSKSEREVARKRAALKRKREKEKVRQQEAAVQNEAKVVAHLQSLTNKGVSGPVKNMKQGVRKLLHQKKLGQYKDLAAAATTQPSSDRKQSVAAAAAHAKKETKQRSKLPARAAVIKKPAASRASSRKARAELQAKQHERANDMVDAKLAAARAQATQSKPMRKRHTLQVNVSSSGQQSLINIAQIAVESKRNRPRRWSIASLDEQNIARYVAELKKKEDLPGDAPASPNLRVITTGGNSAFSTLSPRSPRLSGGRVLTPRTPSKGEEAEAVFKRRSILHANRKNVAEPLPPAHAMERRNSVPDSNATGLLYRNGSRALIDDDAKYDAMQEALRQRFKVHVGDNSTRTYKVIKLNDAKKSDTPTQDGEYKHEYNELFFNSLFSKSEADVETDEVFLAQQNLHRQQLAFLGWYLWSQKSMATRRYAARLRLYRGTRVHKMLNKWHVKACFQGLERAPGLSLSAAEVLLLKRQLERTRADMPRPIQLEIWKTAYPILLTTLRLYKKELGSNSEQYIHTSHHKTQLANQLRGAGLAAFVEKCNKQGTKRNKRRHDSQDDFDEDYVSSNTNSRRSSLSAMSGAISMKSELPSFM